MHGLRLRNRSHCGKDDIRTSRTAPTAGPRTITGMGTRMFTRIHHHERAPSAIDFGGGLAGLHVPGMTQERTISIERDILAKNDAFAAGQPHAAA